MGSLNLASSAMPTQCAMSSPNLLSSQGSTLCIMYRSHQMTWHVSLLNISDFIKTPHTFFYMLIRALTRAYRAQTHLIFAVCFSEKPSKAYFQFQDIILSTIYRIVLRCSSHPIFSSSYQLRTRTCWYLAYSYPASFSHFNFCRAKLRLGKLITDIAFFSDESPL